MNSSRVRVKICGITSVEDGLLAVNAGADAIGLVFYPPSSRNIDDLGLAREITLAAGSFVSVVGLFVDPEAAFVNKVLNAVPLHVLQFHGDENAAFCEQFKRPYMKALRMKEGLNVHTQAAEHSGACAILLDAYKKGVPGGTGESFDWNRVPHTLSKPLVLAGGLTPDNVSVAAAVTRPYAVDVSGGVEASPGIKDKAKVTAFIKNAKVE